MKWKKLQLPMITFLIILKIQLYFVLSLSRNNCPEMPHTDLTGLIRKNLRGGTLSLFSL